SWPKRSSKRQCANLLPKEDAREDGVRAGGWSNRDGERATGGNVDGGVDPGTLAEVCSDISGSRAGAVVNGYGLVATADVPVEGVKVEGTTVSGREKQVQADLAAVVDASPPTA